MGRNEIRLRRQKMSSGRIAQHRNYGQLMQRHERDIRIRRITRIVIYFLIVLVLLIIFLIVSRWESGQVADNQHFVSTVATPERGKSDAVF
jgi:hypothetical protein